MAQQRALSYSEYSTEYSVYSEQSVTGQVKWCGELRIQTNEKKKSITLNQDANWDSDFRKDCPSQSPGAR